MAALLNDPEFADWVAAQPERAPSESLAEWSTVREGLARVEDAINRLYSATVALHSSAPAPQMKAAPRPMTAVEAAKHRRRETDHRALVARVLPNRDAHT